MDKKVLLIIGGSSDIGSALIGKIQAKYDIILTHYNTGIDNVKYLQEQYGSKIIPVQADLGKNSQIQNMVDIIIDQKWNPTDIVCFAAPKMNYHHFIKMDFQNFERDIQSSILGIVYIIKNLLPFMIKKKKGKILFMLSSCVSNNPPKFMSEYVITKYAVLGLMKALSVEYAEKGISVNAVSPDMIETKFIKDIPDMLIASNEDASPMKRLLKTEEVVSAFEFLLSDEAGCITGQNIVISGVRNDRK